MRDGVPVKILVGIPTYRRPKPLRACLESIARQTIEGATVSVLVVDNDPVEQAGFAVVAEIARNYPLPLSCEVVPEPGISAARNAILREGRDSDFIAMLDDDEVASRDWLPTLLRAHADTTADVVGGPVAHRFAIKPSSQVISSGMFTMVNNPTGRIEIVRGGGNFLVSTAALNRAGWPPFDPAFGLSGGEDYEWFLRLKKSGLSFAWAAAALAIETVPPERMETAWILNRACLMGNVYRRIFRKHKSRRQVAVNFGKSAALMVAYPLLSPLLLTKKRLWLLTKTWRALGKFGVKRGGYGAVVLK